MDCSDTLLAPRATAEAEVENPLPGLFLALVFTAVARGSIENQSCVEVACSRLAGAGLPVPAPFCRPLLWAPVEVAHSGRNLVMVPV